MLTPSPEQLRFRLFLAGSLILMPASLLAAPMQKPLEIAQVVTGPTPEPENQASDKRRAPRRGGVTAGPSPLPGNKGGVQAGPRPSDWDKSNWDDVMVGPSPLPSDRGEDVENSTSIHHELTEFEKSQMKPLPPRSLWERLRDCQDDDPAREGWLRNMADTDASAPIFAQRCGVDWHKPIFMLPYTYSRDYESDQTEVVFGISAKLRPLSLPIYLAYSQRNFWSLYDDQDSRPFRETVYNPEIFYRWTPKLRRVRDWSWGFDGGYEHESNGRDLPSSRSWDRLYFAPFFERGATAAQLKVWYRIPEDGRTDINDPSGDDNPDIEQFYGYTELHLYRRFDRDRPFHVMIRGNPSTGRGAIQIDHGWRIGQGNLFWHAYLWHGYGESLTDYNDSVTRIGVGFSMNR